MRIVLGLGVNEDVKRGVEYFADNLVEHLAPLDRRNRYLLFTFFFRDYERKVGLLPRLPAPNFELAARRWPDSLVRMVEWDWGLPLIRSVLLRGEKIDLYHAIGNPLPHFGKTRTLVTFYDLPETFDARGRSLRGGAISPRRDSLETARRATALTAISEATKRDLVELYGVPEEKVTVIPTGVNLRVFRPIEDPRVLDDARRRYRLPERFFMVIGPFDPPWRNNAELTLRAFARLKKEGKTSGAKLVFVGGGRQTLPRLEALARELGVADDLVKTGFVPHEDLPALYTLALALAHPTGYEGFGFGLEAMACGTPVLSSNTPAIVEGLGDAALLIERGDLESLTGKLAALAADAGLRRALSEKGRARAKLFAYEALARRMLALYERLGAAG